MEQLALKIKNDEYSDESKNGFVIQAEFKDDSKLQLEINLKGYSPMGDLQLKQFLSSIATGDTIVLKKQ